mmetsp:Transcript_51971/g.137510  ORF Transcript_51971/g.137510 Transcript_51971/m.137510 type:complete len:555 (-) Transcript_51971:7-1671(-)
MGLALLVQGAHVGVEVPGILVEVLMGCKLRRIHKDRHHNHIAVLRRSVDELQVPLMQVAHGRHKPHLLPSSLRVSHRGADILDGVHHPGVAGARLLGVSQHHAHAHRRGASEGCLASHATRLRMRPLVRPVCVASRLGHGRDLLAGAGIHRQIHLYPSQPVQPPQLLLGHVLAMLWGREAPLLDLLHVLPDRPLSDGAQLRILLHEGGDGGAGGAQHVVAHQHLAGGPAAGANADGGGAELAGDELGDLSRDALKHNSEAPRLLQRLGLAEQLESRLSANPLLAVPSQGHVGLGRQAHVAHHANAGLDEGAGGLHGFLVASLQLHHVCLPILEQPSRIVQRVPHGHVRTEGHVPDQQRHAPRPAVRIQPPAHSPGHHQHLLHGDLHGGVVPQADVGHGVPDQDDVHPAVRRQLAHGAVVGGEHGDLRALEVGFLEGAEADLLLFADHAVRTFGSCALHPSRSKRHEPALMLRERAEIGGEISCAGHHRHRAHIPVAGRFQVLGSDPPHDGHEGSLGLLHPCFLGFSCRLGSAGASVCARRHGSDNSPTNLEPFS